MDTAATQEETGPKRYLDSAPAAGRTLILCRAMAAENDQTLQARFSWLKTTAQKQQFFRYVGLLNIFRHYFRLRRAPLIHAGCPHYFWWLILLNRIGLFPIHNRLVFNYCFRANSFLKWAKWWNRAPHNFRVFFAAKEQIDQLAASGIRRDGIGYLRWRIDTDWFAPTARPGGGYLLVPGNSHRDEEFVLRLAMVAPLPIIRVGQMGCLQEIYRSSPVELRFNLSHSEYRDLLQNAAAVLLPIEECDEPAGLTATLEALACGTPVLANPSLEVGSVLTDAVGLSPIPVSNPEAWVTSIRAILHGSLYPVETRLRGREFVQANHSIDKLASPIASVLEFVASPKASM